jgi:plastocyanin
MVRVLGWALAAPLLLAACGGANEQTTDPTPKQPAQEEEPAEEPAADVVLVGTADFRFEPQEVQAEAGTISVALTSEGGPHTFTLELEGEQETVAQVFAPGQTDVGEVELEAGTYTFYCTIPGHLEEGMEGTLTVS